MHPRSGQLRNAMEALPFFCLAACYHGVELDPGTGDAADRGDADDGSDGADDASEEDTGAAPTCDDGPGVSPKTLLRRLTPTEYANTMADLLGDPGFVAEYDALEPIITESGVRQLRNGAEAALDRREHWTAPVFACDLSGPADDACVDALVETFAPRAFRRPLREDERQWLHAVYDDAREEMDFADAMEILAQAILQAPAFVYLEEVGVPVEDAPEEIRALTDYEIASRLSYLLWDTMPDEALLSAAAEGRLTASDGLAQEVDRMLDDPRAEPTVQRFIWQWLQLDGGPVHSGLEYAEKDAVLFPEYGPPLQDAMRTELEALVGRVLEDGGDFDDLLSSRQAFVNRSLADLYGVESGPPDDDSWAWVDLDPTQRSGLLTRAAFLTVYAGPKAQSPIRRGVAVLEDVLCFEIGDPPPNVNDVPPQGSNGDDGDARTTREEVDLRTAEPECKGCHGMINPVGFSLEHYDAIGRWQDNEFVDGLPVDSATEITAPAEIAGVTKDAVELSDRLAATDRVQACVAERWFEEALGRDLGEEETCAREHVLEEFGVSGDLHTLMREVVLSAPFRYINTADAEVEDE